MDYQTTPYTMGGSGGKGSIWDRIAPGVSKMLAAKKNKLDPEKELEGYARPGAGEDEFARLIDSQYNRLMPQFNQSLQGLRENAIQRGISTGDLGTSYEGDLASAFQQHLLDSISGGAMDLYNTRLDLLSGMADRKLAAKNAKRQGKGSMLGGLFGLGGSILGGPIGGAIGKGLGKLF